MAKISQQVLSPKQEARLRKHEFLETPGVSNAICHGKHGLQAGLIKKQEVLRLTGWSSSTLYNRMAAKEFGRPVSTGPRSVAWPAREVYAYLEQLVVERDAKDLKRGAA